MKHPGYTYRITDTSVVVAALREHEQAINDFWRAVDAWSEELGLPRGARLVAMSRGSGEPLSFRGDVQGFPYADDPPPGFHRYADGSVRVYQAGRTADDKAAKKRRDEIHALAPRGSRDTTSDAAGIKINFFNQFGFSCSPLDLPDDQIEMVINARSELDLDDENFVEQISLAEYHETLARIERQREAEVGE